MGKTSEDTHHGKLGGVRIRGSSQPWSPRHLLRIKYSSYAAYLPRFLPLLLQEVPFLPTFHCVVEVEHHPQTPAMTPVAHSRPSAPSYLPGTSSAPAPETVSGIGTQHRPHCSQPGDADSVATARTRTRKGLLAVKGTTKTESWVVIMPQPGKCLCEWTQREHSAAKNLRTRLNSTVWTARSDVPEVWSSIQLYRTTR